jgi:hypothetical protein
MPEELQSLLQELDLAYQALSGAAQAYAVLRSPSRTIQRIRRAASRPVRIAILGEANSGKSTIANLVTGGMTLPALPVANTRLPTLLYYAQRPAVHAARAGGERLPLSIRDESLGLDAARLEVGLPSAILRGIEILDCPGSGNPLFPSCPKTALQHGADAAIWATVATQAWRETERLAWLGLPARIKSRGVLAVTHCDLIQTQADFEKLKARIEPIAAEHFSALCFTSAPGSAAPAGAGAAGLLAAIESIAQRVEKERAQKALVLVRRLATQTLAQLEAGPGSA